MPLREQTVLVLGLGDTGLSMVRWLRGAGATVRVADSRAEPPHLAAMHAEFADIRCDCGPFQASSFDGIDLIALSPGVPLAEPLVQDAVRRGVQVTGDVELFARALNKYFPRVRTIAITGSNGKSTVTSMVGAMCSKAGFNTVVAGNIGLPVLDALGQVLSSGATPDIFVLELSSFQLETTRHLYPDAATVLNISEDHMDRYPSLSAYASVKARIFNGEGVQVINRDDPIVDRMAGSGRRVWTFSQTTPVSPSDFGLIMLDDGVALAQGNRVLCAPANCHWPACTTQPTRWRPSPCAAPSTCPSHPCWPPSANSAACRIGSSSWPKSARCATTTIPRAPMSAQPSQRSQGSTARWC